MPDQRKNVWELGSDWSDTILWYARGVGVLKSRPIADRTSWRFFGAMHGIDEGLWRQLGYLREGEPLASQSDQDVYWSQCQHQSWYFLPWHRGYLSAFEAMIRAAVVSKGGPADWALPYWNYNKAGQNALPPAFASADWPDGQGNNPLFVAQRYGPDNDGNVYVPQSEINLNALGDPDFTGTASGGSPGFGGVETDFSHSGNVSGDLENQPHNYVHGLVGGGDPNTNLPGLMSDPDTAALDPIFWLHHANIDRLWEVWRQIKESNTDPTDPPWLSGPAAGERKFAMPAPDGSEGDYTPADVSDLSKLDYSYDDLSNPVPGPSRRRRRLQKLGIVPMEAAMGEPKQAELMGANAAPIRLGAADAHTEVKLDTGVKAKVANSLMMAAPDSEPDRVFLNLENVRGTNDAAAFRVYINLPEGADPADHPERLAGAVALFGVRKASRTDDAHAGNGLTYVLDITHIVDDLHLKGSLDANALKVRIVPRATVRDADNITVDRVSVYREGR